MQIRLENLKYQQTAIDSVVKVFDGNEKNNFDNACDNGIRSNMLGCTREEN
jgi:type III restriction enzyme